MASSKYLELQDISDEDLASQLEQTEAQYQNQKFEHAIKGLENPLTLREARRDVARLQTEIRRRQLATMSKEELNNRSKIRERRRQGK
jgi:large subunit ribosomal protein L29